MSPILRKYELHSEIQSIFREFESRADGIFSVTKGLQVQEHWKGLYGIAYIKPERRIARLLAADREILLLISTFAEQQARTVEFAADLIVDSGARLENTLTVIIHRDERGSAKLRNWGRDQGLTVIPLFVRGFSLPGGQQLERILFSEFYSHDPFDVTGPVYKEGQFYGRRDEAQDLARHLQQGQIRAALGIRRIGKTSVINRVLFVAEDYHSCYNVILPYSPQMRFGGDT